MALQHFTYYARTLNARPEHRFYALWILFNTVGWSTALIIGTIITGGVLPDLQICLIPLTGMLVGGIIGAFQGVPLRQLMLKQAIHREWTVSSAVGGMLGAIGVSLVLFTVILGAATSSIITGIIFGLCMGAVQSVVLYRELPDFPFIWIAANGFAGCLCSLCAYGFNPLSLPIYCTLGPPLFGIVTAFAWRIVLNMDIDP
jgi:hypothetical protein